MSDKEKTKSELIEELTRMRQQFVVSEEKYRILVDNTQTPITYLTTDSYILLINKIGAKNLGGTPEQFVGKSLHEVLPSLAEITESRIAGIVQSSIGAQFEDMITLPEGEQRWFLSNFQPVKDASGQLFAVQIISYDNTERKQAEEKLKQYQEHLEELIEERSKELQEQITKRERADKKLGESKERFKSILENSPNFILEVDRDLKIIYVNRPAPGHTIEAALGTSPLDYILPENQELFTQTIQQTFRDAVPTSIETAVKFPDGKNYALETRFGPITREGKVTSVIMVAIDITERKRIEEALRSSEVRFRSVADTAPDGIITINRDGVITYCNPGAATIFGYNEEELTNTPIIELIPEKSRPRYRSSIQKMGEGREPSKSGEIIMDFGLKKTGAQVPVELTFARWFIGAEPFFTAIIRDITERVKAEKVIRRSEAQFRSIFENVTDAILYVNLTGTIIDANRKVKDLCGCEPAELIGKSFVDADFLTLDSIDDIMRTLSETVINNATPQPLQITINHRNGSKVIAETSPSMVKMEDGTEGILAIIRDITKRVKAEQALKESERVYRELVENASDIIYTHDLQGNFLSVNPIALRVYGYDKEDILKTNVSQIVDPEHLQKTLQYIQAKIDGLPETGPYEILTHHKDGRPIWVEVNTRLLKQNGQPVGVQGIARDITERKKAELALKASEEKYKTLTNNLNVGVYRNTPGDKGKFMEVNPAHFRMLGYESREEFLSVNVADLYQYPEERKTISKELSDKGFVKDRQVELKKKDGTLLIGCISAVAVKDEQGNVLYFDGFLEDITERKKAELALMESEEKYRSLIENINDAVFSVDTKGYFTYASPVIERIWGYKVEEVLGRHFADFVVPEDLPGLAESFKKTLNGQTEPSEFRMIDKDGTMHYVRTSSRLLFQENRLIGLTGIVTDITARKQAEEELLKLNKELITLNTIAQTMIQPLELDSILSNALNMIQKTLDIKHCFVSLVEGNHMVLRAHRGISAKNLDIIKKWDLKDGLLGQTVRSGEPRFVESIANLAGNMKENLAKVVIENRLGPAMYVPLSAKGKTLGVLVAIKQNDRTFTPEEKDLMITIGHQLSTVVENALLYEDLRREGEIRREGLRHAILAQEEERRRIARELHDQTSQVLTGASAMIEAAVATLPLGLARTKDNLIQVRSSLTSMLVDVRNIIYELRPTLLDDLGLVAAARWQAEEFLVRSGVKAKFETKGRIKKLSPQTETALFRIIQEATTNIVKHANAKSARITIGFGRESVKLKIEDDGKGFILQEAWTSTKERRGLGLVSMRERTEILSGKFVVDSQPGSGTRITVEVPS